MSEQRSKCGFVNPRENKGDTVTCSSCSAHVSEELRCPECGGPADHGSQQGVFGLVCNVCDRVWSCVWVRAYWEGYGRGQHDAGDQHARAVASMMRDIEIRDRCIQDLERALKAADRRADALRKARDVCREELAYRPPRVRTGWALGDTAACAQCGSPLLATAHDTGDGWYASWDCPQCAVVAAAIDWPFQSDTAWASDWLAVGIKVL